MKTYRPWAPHQAYLLPPAPDDWLPKEHLAYFILDVVGELDLSAIENVLQAKDPRGEKAYDPQMMVAVLLYSYSVGVFSSRRIARATFEDVATRFLSGDQHPHFTRIAAFRREHLEALGALFLQSVRLCERTGLVTLGHVAIDGTKLEANASKHKAMSYDRMKKTEARLREEIATLLAKAEAVDTAEDEEFGAESEGLDIPAELRRRETRLARIRQAKAELEEEARQARAGRLRELAMGNDERAEDAPTQKERTAARTRAEKQRKQADELAGRDDDDEPPEAPSLPLHEPPVKRDGTPKPGAQRNFTDPDSKIMVGGSGAFTQGYNAQAAVTEGHQIIVACPLSNSAPDVKYLVPTLTEVEANIGQLPSKVTADTGYWSASNAAHCEAIGVDAYIATGRKSRGPPSAGAAATPRDEMAAKLQSSVGKDTYRRRKFTVEPVFGQIKGARGFRRFLLRGIEKVQQEWALVCATHNLLKLFRARWVPA
jgi:transposase